MTRARCGETEKTACIAGADIRSKLAYDAAPSTSAIGGLVLVAQLGAPISDVNDQYLVVWGLVALYGSIAVILEMFKRARVEQRAHLDSHGDLIAAALAARLSRWEQ